MAEYVVGMQQLEKRLNMLSTIAQRQAVRRALRRAAKVEKLAEELSVPVVTGTMFSQFVVRAIRRSRRGIGYAVRMRNKAGQRWYASFVNYGWRGRPVGPRFIDHAVDASAKAVLDIAVSGVMRELDKLGV